MLGLTSVTFRKLQPLEIIKLAKEANLDAIEWGSDVHVVVGNYENARYIRKITEENQLKVIAYGSYYRLEEKVGCYDEFSRVLKTAVELNAQTIRVWAGSESSADVTNEKRKELYKKLIDICNMAKNYNINIALEYHRGTLTDNYKSTKLIFDNVKCNNFFTYWQPNPDITVEEHFKEINELLPHIKEVHTFNWKGNNVRYPLQEGYDIWLKYLELIGKDVDYVMEFVKDDSTTQFKEDAKILTELYNR